MDILERYKQLSNEDKSNLTMYTIYDSIYDVSRNREILLDDNTVKKIQELAYDLYIEDEYYNFSSDKIAYFLTECYSIDKDFLNKVDDIDYDDILEAIDNDDINFFKDNEMER